MKRTKYILIVVIIIIVSIFAIGCSNKQDDNNSESAISTLTELKDNQTLVVSNNKFKNYTETQETEVYQQVQNTYTLSLGRTTAQNTYTVNNCTFTSVLADDGYYYYWSNYNYGTYSTEKSVLLGKKTVTTKTTYEYAVYSKDSIVVETKTETTTSYDYESQFLKVKADGVYMLNGYFGTTTVDSLDGISNFPITLVNIANDILDNFVYVINSPTTKTITTYNKNAYNDTYFYLLENTSGIKIVQE